MSYLVHPPASLDPKIITAPPSSACRGGTPIVDDQVPEEKDEIAAPPIADEMYNI